MKRILTILFIIIIVLSSLYSIDSRYIELYFEKVSPIKLGFYNDEQGIEIKKSVDFPLLDSNNSSAETEKFYIVWDIALDKNLKLDLILSSEETIAEKGYCLTHIKDLNDGLNYVAKIDEQEVKTLEEENRNSEIEKELRTYNIFTNNDTDIHKGSVAVSLKIDPPQYQDQGETFLEGPYKGYLILKLESF